MDPCLIPEGTNSHLLLLNRYLKKKGKMMTISKDMEEIEDMAQLQQIIQKPVKSMSMLVHMEYLNRHRIEHTLLN